MDTVYYDSPVDDDIRRNLLYEGRVFVYSPRPGSLALRDFARTLIEKRFEGLDPQTAQAGMPVGEYAAILSKLKPEFIHHQKSKELIRRLLAEMGCDLLKTYFDVPRMRTSTSGGYLTTGIAYAWHPHRDTWYSAPDCQINWWIPIYDIVPENAMAFHPEYWGTPVPNSSASYNYAEWNRIYRFDSAKYIKEDSRPLPRATVPLKRNTNLRLICPAGGIMVFSAAQMHSSVPNTSGVTRFSIDFRTVHFDDVTSFRGARNVDSMCTGTTMNDYLRAVDLAHIPVEIAALYEERSFERDKSPVQDEAGAP